MDRMTLVYEDMTPLCVAVACGNMAVAQALLEHGADPNLEGSRTRNG